MQDKDRTVRGSSTNQQSARFMGLGGQSTETIDLTKLFTKDVTASGSFDLRGLQGTSIGKLLETLPTPVFLVDDAFRVIFANKSCVKISPSYEKLLGAAFSSLIPAPPASALAESAFREVFSTRRPKTAEALLEFEGSGMWGRLNLRSLRLGRTRAVLVLVEDLTFEKQRLIANRRLQDELENGFEERTRELGTAMDRLRSEVTRRDAAEAALKAGEERYRAVVDELPDLICHVSSTGTVTFANRALCNFFDAMPHEFPGTTYKELFPGDAGDSGLPLRASVDPGSPLSSWKNRLKRKDGSLLWYHWTCHAFFDQKGSPVEYRLIGRAMSR